MLTVSIKRLSDKFADLPLPHFETTGSAGMDVSAAVDSPIVLKPHEIRLVPTNLALSIPEGYECQVRSRSGLALKHGVFCLNAPGTIDSDYRGEIGVILANFSEVGFVITRGMRIAQLVFSECQKVRLVEVNELDSSDRSSGGFGSTGI